MTRQSDEGDTSFRIARRVLWGPAAIVVIVLGMMAAIRWATVDGTQADPETGGVVVLGGIAMAVERALPGYELEDAAVWEASQAPPPEFDPSSLGPDRSFTPGEPPIGVFGGLEGDIVYFGYQDGEAMILHATAAVERNPWDHIYSFFTGHRDRRILDATFPCCAVGLNEVDGIVYPEVLLQAPVIGGPVVQWLGVPASTAVVAVLVDGEEQGYQRPVGGIVTMELDVEPPFVVAVTAYDATGAVLLTEVIPVHAAPDR